MRKNNLFEVLAKIIIILLRQLKRLLLTGDFSPLSSFLQEPLFDKIFFKYTDNFAELKKEKKYAFNCYNPKKVNARIKT